jgi:toxic protein SymE
MSKERIRRVKLHGKYRALTGSWGYSPGKAVPWLNVSGVWLEELGFKIGDTVSITTREKLLIIELLEGEAKEQQEYKAALSEVKQTLKKLAQ